jgi:hypothetical protein
MSDEETALYGTLPRTLGHTVVPPAGTVFHNKAERLGYIRAGLVRIAWQEYDDCRRAPLKPGEQRSCYPPSSPRP